MYKNYFLMSVLMVTFTSQSAFAFDPEDYASTERATLDALIRAENEFILAGPPHKAALEAYKGATLQYTSTLKIPSPSGDLLEVNILKQK